MHVHSVINQSHYQNQHYAFGGNDHGRPARFRTKELFGEQHRAFLAVLALLYLLKLSLLLGHGLDALEVAGLVEEVKANAQVFQNRLHFRLHAAPWPVFQAPWPCAARIC